MSDADLSKRERQKARRAARLEQEAAAAKAARRNRLVATVALAAVVLAGIGFLVYRQIDARNRRAQQEVELAGRLDELGCTEDVRMPDLGGGHIASTPEELAAEPPATIYPDRPPTSGRHVGQVVASGVYDVPIDERITLHNLEHGYLNVWYAEDAPEDQVDAMKAWAEEQRDGDFPKMIVAPFYDELPDGGNFAYVAWFQRQVCRDFDPEVAQFFAEEHYDSNGEAPERGIGNHEAGAQGVLDPAGAPLFLPPLDAQFGAESVLDEAQEQGVTPDEEADGATGDAATDGGTPGAEASAPEGTPTAATDEAAEASEAPTE